MYVYMYCMYVHMHIVTYTSIYVCIYECIFLFICVCLYFSFMLSSDQKVASLKTQLPQATCQSILEQDTEPQNCS